MTKRTEAQIEAVEAFFERMCVADPDSGAGNLSIHFIGMPRMYTLRIATTEGEVSGTGASLKEAIAALGESAVRMRDQLHS
jgi:hypothetical protein